MSRAILKRWLPVALYGMIALGLFIFGFIPYNRQARLGSQQAQALATQLEAKVAMLERLPGKKSELDSLVASLDTFRSGLRRTDEVYDVMDSFKQRANASGVELWILNPSVPALVEMDSGADSVAKLDLAVLPISFECRGKFEDVGRFLEQEETRSDFCKWQKLAVSVDLRDGGVHALGDAYLFLLPETNFREPAS